MWLVNHKDFIDIVTEIATAVGTVGAVIVALWLAYQSNKVKLKPNGFIGVIMPDKEEFLWMSCVNIGRQSAICTGIVFAINRFSRLNKFSKNNLRIMLTSYASYPQYKSSTLPLVLQYGERIDCYFKLNSLQDKQIKKVLGEYKWLAKLRLRYLWRVVATTNISEFHGRLSNSLISKLISIHFPDK